MRPECAASVRAAAGGREISDAKLAAIDDALGGHLRELARQARAEARAAGKPNRWLALTREQQMAEAVARAMEDIQAQAALKEYRAQLQVTKTAEVEQAIARLQASGSSVSRSQGYARFLQEVENRVHAVRNMAAMHLDDLFKAAENRDGTGALRSLGMRVFGLDNPQMTADVVREVFRGADGFTGNKAAQAAAKAWLDVSESMRQRFNAAGGAIGKLGYGYLTQAHDALRVLDTGADGWAAKVLPLLDREQYVRADGALMDDAQVLDMLRGAHRTIASEGANHAEPGAFRGVGARANRGADHRVLHFKDGDAWIAYMKDFGQGSLYDSMIGHLNRMARDIALVEAMGPNPAQQHRVQADIARRADHADTLRGVLRERAQGSTPESYWQLVSGNAGAAENRIIARIGQDLRNVQTAAKITAGPLAAFGDMATIAMTLHFNRLPFAQMLRQIGKQFDAEQRDFLRSQGVIAESLVNDMQRFTGDHFTHSLTGQVTNAVMRLSFLNAWTDGLRAAFAGTMMRNWARNAGKGWSDLDQWDRFLLGRKGITESDWAIIGQTAPVHRGGEMYLSATGIGDAAAATKWLSFVNDESQFAVVNPDLAARSIVTGGGARAGTPTGEAWRSIMQFKSFPIALMTRHWQRVLDTPQGLDGAPAGFGGDSKAAQIGGKVAMLAAFAFMATMLGAIQTQARQVAAGKDPVDMTGDKAEKFWARAFAAGGGGGFLADVLMRPLDDPSRGFEGTMGMFGPVAGAVGGLIDTAKAEKDRGARAAQWANDQLPGVDIFYLRAAWEHWFLHNAQEALSPGYLARMQQRARKAWGNDYWWEPGEMLPSAAPDLAAAVGQ